MSCWSGRLHRWMKAHPQHRCHSQPRPLLPCMPPFCISSYTCKSFTRPRFYRLGQSPGAHSLTCCAYWHIFKRLRQLESITELSYLLGLITRGHTMPPMLGMLCQHVPNIGFGRGILISAPHPAMPEPRTPSKAEKLALRQPLAVWKLPLTWPASSASPRLAASTCCAASPDCCSRTRSCDTAGGSVSIVNVNGAA